MTSEKPVCGMQLSPRQDYEENMRAGFTELALAIAETGNLDEEAIRAAQVADFEKEIEMGNYNTAAVKARLYDLGDDRIKIAEQEAARPFKKTEWYKKTMANVNKKVTWTGVLRDMLSGLNAARPHTAQIDDPKLRTHLVNGEIPYYKLGVEGPVVKK